jgi:hypothetical protein
MHISNVLSAAALPFLLHVQQVASAIMTENAAGAIIEKDIVIIGGGASGAHAAVRLREDYGKSVIIVEKQDNLVIIPPLQHLMYRTLSQLLTPLAQGGHVETYIDPVSGNPYDYGVNSYTEYGDAEAFFTRFNISLQTPVRLSLTTTYADF